MSVDTHTRNAPNGCQVRFSIVGSKDIDNLRFGDRIKIVVGGKAIKAVVDIMVAAFWGGPKRAFLMYDAGRGLYHVERKIVWQAEDGSWEEFRFLWEATEKEFLAWRSQFVGDEPPTPMP